MKVILSSLFGILILSGCWQKASMSISVTPDEVIVYNSGSLILADDTMDIFIWDTEANQASPTLVSGEYRRQGDNVIFNPNFSLLENTTYALVIHGNASKPHLFSLPKINNELHYVTSVYPTSDTLPENLLRMYISFSQPMRTTDNLEHIHLLDSQGRNIEGAIFNNVYELWDDSQTQLTIIFDPARVKTGLVAHESLGRALRPGVSYKLVIDSLVDVHGNVLSSSFEKSFIVSPADLIKPNVNSWQVKIPNSQTTVPLQMTFVEPVDKMSLLHRIKVVDQENEIVQGSITIGNLEKSWSFHPTLPWEEGNYTIAVNTRLADPSGNNLNGLFDHISGSLLHDEEGTIEAIKINIQP